MQIFVSVAQRDYQIADDFIKKHIPPKSKVVGEPMYFYSVIKADSDFQYMNYFEELEEREKRQREVYQYDYLIVTEHLAWREPLTVKHYLTQAKFEKFAELHLPQNTWTQKINSFHLISDVERTGYSCTIYKRLKK